MRFLSWAAALALAAPAAARAGGLTLETMWPNQDGLRWQYEFNIDGDFGPGFTTPAVLQLTGTTPIPGGTAQVLLGDHALPPDKTSRATTAAPAGLDPLLRRVWRARPDLRAGIAARADHTAAISNWWPIFVHPGWFAKSAANIQMWQPDSDHPTWTYLTSDLQVGATFSQQLIPELADNVFLHATVDALDATVTTPAATFTNALRMKYRVDYGWAEGLDENGDPVGRFRSESLAIVHFVPDVGPAKSVEDFVQFVEIDCAPNACPQEWEDALGRVRETMTLSLTSLPVGVQERSWTGIKALYR